MSTTKKVSSRKGQDKNNKNKNAKLWDKSMSFHGQAGDDMVGKLGRPKTDPDLRAGIAVSSNETLRPKLTKLLLNVTVERSLGPVHVLISLDSTVRDLVADSLRQYSKEGRRPILLSLDPSAFGLHYSQFSLKSLDPDEKLIDLGSRNFFLCSTQTATAARSGDDDDGRDSFSYGTVATTSAQTSSTCSNEVESVTKSGVRWLGFMNFM